MLELTLQVCLEEVAALGENYRLRGGWEETTAVALLAFLHQEVPEMLAYPVVLILPEPTRPGAIYELSPKGTVLISYVAVDTHHASGDREETASPFRFFVFQKEASMVGRDSPDLMPVEAV